MRNKIVAYIDSQNFHSEMRKAGWNINYRRFLRFIKDKYRISEAIMFLGFVNEYDALYKRLRRYGYHIIFKKVTRHKGVVKGNVDIDIAIQVMHDFYNTHNRFILLTADGDFYPLAKYLAKANRLERILIPNVKHYSVLLREFRNRLSFLNEAVKKFVSKHEE